MALTIWTEDGPGYRSPIFFERIARSLERCDFPASYIVPNAGAKRRAEVLCLSHGAEIVFGDRIITMSEWFERLAKAHQPVLGDTQRHPTLRALLKTVPLEYFRTSATAATCTLIARGIVSALHAGISPAQLHHLAKDYGQEREQDLARLFEAYLAQLDKDHWIDAAQIPIKALDSVRNGAPVSARRIIVEVGMAPAPILWKILRALAPPPASTDLHVIVPEYHRSRAEAELGVLTQVISPDEWITAPDNAQVSASEALRLYRAPHPTAQYRWMARQLGEDTGVLALNNDPTLWLEACMAEGAINDTALPLPLTVSPVSAPWYDPAIWQRAPTAATLGDWMLWWRKQLYPESQIHDLQQKIPDDDFSCRALREVAQWESVWLNAAASTPATQSLTFFDLRTLIDPMLQTIAHMDAAALPYTSVSLLSHLGERISNLFVLDATQSLLPNAAGTSPFFKSAAILPQDPNAQFLRDAFPSTDLVLQLQIAAWQRLSGCAAKITASYAVSSDSLGEQIQSLLLDAIPQDIPAPAADKAQPSPNVTAETLLSANDTITHVRQRMKTHTFSISELEDFAECHFRHFARYLLGINVPDEEGPEIPAKDEGKIIHKLLECFYRNPHAELNDMFGEARTNAARKLLSDILASEIQTTAPLQQIQIERLLQAATDAVTFDMTTHDRLGAAALQPTHLEWTFGSENVPPLTLNAAGVDPVNIRGKVDRIDINPTTRRLLLIDYKYSPAKAIVGKIKKGAHLQIPLYLMAAKAAFTDFTLLGGLLFDLRQVQRCHGMAHKSEAGFLGIEGRPQSLTKDDTWHELLQTAAAHAVDYARQIRGGKVPIKEHTCDYCDWKGLLPWEE